FDEPEDDGADAQARPPADQLSPLEAGQRAAADPDDFLAAIPNDFRRLTPQHWPLFLTATKLLLMLDGSAGGARFFQSDEPNIQELLRDDDESSAACSAQHRVEDLIDFDRFAALYW